MQVTEITTSKFSGEILVMNAEACGKNYKGGFMLYDVSNPEKPVKLAEGWRGARARTPTRRTAPSSGTPATGLTSSTRTRRTSRT